MNVQAVVFDQGEQISIREVGLPELQNDQIRTETLYSFVSPGTELRTLAGHYGASKNFPIIPGYSSVSRVVEIGSEVKSYRIGDLLSLRGGGGFIGATAYWGGEAGGHVLSQEGTQIKLPSDTAENPLSYAVTEVAAISYRGVQSADPQPGEHEGDGQDQSDRPGAVHRDRREDPGRPQAGDGGVRPRHGDRSDGRRGRGTARQ